MIPVRVNRPLREKDIRLLRIKQAAELVIMRIVHNRAPIRLRREQRTRLQQLAGFRSFRAPDPAAVLGVRSLTESLSPVQVEKDDIVPQVAVPCDRSAAAALRVSR